MLNTKNRIIRLFLCLSLCFLIFSCKKEAKNSSSKGTVVRVKDGDTVVVLTGDKKRITVRIADIDCPEKKQAFGLRAKQFTVRQVSGKQVTLVKKDIDRYGRTVGYILYGQRKDLSEELLKAGMAWNYVKYSKKKLYQQLENVARTEKKGLWVDRHPIPPWEFRHRKKRHHRK